MSNLRKKLDLTLVGVSFSILNILLIETRFNLVGIGFGIFGFILLIKALRIRG